VNGAAGAESAELVFAWAEPVIIGEVIYYARTAWFMNECWRNCALCFYDAPEPLLTAPLEMKDGPQRITLSPPVRARKLVMRFSQSYGGPNPGASEVQIFSTPPSAEALKELARQNGQVQDAGPHGQSE